MTSSFRQKVNRPKTVRCRLAPARPVGALWTILSFLVSITCLFSFVQPVWFTGRWPDAAADRSVAVRLKPTSLTLGLFTFCQQLHGAQAHHCQSYERMYALQIPHSFVWQLSVVSLGVGTIILLLTSVVAFATLCCDDYRNRRISLIAGHVQLVSVLSMAFGLTLLPTAFGTPLLQAFCGPDASPYQPGHCHIGWSYVLAIMGTMLAMFCPFLARHTSFQSFDVDALEIILPTNSPYRKLYPTKEYYI